MRNRMASVGVIASSEGPAERFKAGMLEHNFVEGRNIRFETRLARGDSGILANLARQLVDQRVDLIAVVGAVGARAARSVTSSIPIVYAVVVDPAGDGLATSRGHPLPNMTGVTTFDAGQAQVQLTLLQSIDPGLTTVAYLADAAVSDCLANANLRAARDAGLRATLLRIVGPHPDLDGAFKKIQQEYIQAIVALEQPAIGANACKIAERACALNIPSIFARDQAGCGGLFGYGTSLGGAAHVMARPASRVLGGEAPIDIPIESFCSPELVADMATARDLGLVVAPAVLRNAVRVN
jgi:putative tryptophan/tyrosine transport system substrate-binding protein